MEPLVGGNWHQFFLQLSSQDLQLARTALDEVWFSRIGSDPLHSASAAPLSHQPHDTSIRGTSAYSGDTALPGLGRDSRSASVVDSNTESHIPGSNFPSPPTLLSPTNTPQATSGSAGRSCRRNSAISFGRQKYFCTHSHLHDEVVRFRHKHDWKRHERDFHETGSEYTCPVPDCVSVFSRERDFQKHCCKVHRIKDPAITSRVHRKMPEKRYYACGFENCWKLTTTFDDWCDHVARCMKEGGKEWSNDAQMLNLMRQPDVAEIWSEVVSTGSSHYHISPAQLTWDPKASRLYKEMLECRTYGHDLRGFLKMVWMFGAPLHTVSPGSLSDVTANAYNIQPMPQYVGTQNNMNGNETGNEHFKLAPSPRPRGFSSQTQSPQEFFQSFVGDTSIDNTLDTTNNRMSVAMTEAPPFVTAHDTNINEYPPFAMSNDGGMTVEDVLLSQPHFATPPVPYFDEAMGSSTTGQCESSPKRRSFARLSRDIFHHFKSDQSSASPMPGMSQIASTTSVTHGSPRRSNYEVLVPYSLV